MTALKSANKELKGMMKTVRIEDIDVSLFMPCPRIVSSSVAFWYQFGFDFDRYDYIFICLFSI